MIARRRVLLAVVAFALAVISRVSSAQAIKWGDVNADGTIGAVDAQAILTSVVGLSLPTGFKTANGDANCDGGVGAIDAQIVLSYVVGISVSQFCVGTPIIAAPASPNPWPNSPYRGVTGRGVIVAIIDRGIQWQHPDFIKLDGTTRIKWMLDMSGQNGCSPSNPPAVEYSEAQINAALATGSSLGMRDAVGHGTVTAGIATGNGRAAANGKYAGVAPEADLIIVKVTSDGAPAHGDQPAENGFVACYADALDWVDQKVATMGKPVATLINSGVQLWGPTDGTSALSRKIDQQYGNRPGHIFISPTGDEGDLPTHAGGTYSSAPVNVSVNRSSGTAGQLAIWYSGTQSAEVTVAFDDGATVGPVGPGGFGNSNGITVTPYIPGQEFFPVTSTSGDHFVLVQISGHATTGHITITGQGSGTGKFDIYSDYSVTTAFLDHLVPGRLIDQSSTHSAIVVGAAVNLNSWTDIDGIARNNSPDVVGSLWTGSAAGPTRDGRIGVDIVTAGENVFAAYATTSYWDTFRGNLTSDGGLFYGRQGATSGAAPIALGAAALMLQLNPALTSEQARTLFHNTAISDANTGATPNNAWGYGRINIPGLIDQLLPGGSSVRLSAARLARDSSATSRGAGPRSKNEHSWKK